jgi:tripartite-type tricarboxylate transporter receptor subunit TctC
MRALTRFFIAGIMAAILPISALAQAYPDKPVRIVVPFPAGATLDGVGRLIAPKLKEKFGQVFIIENKSGAAGNVGAEFVLRAPTDGYTLLLTAPATLVVNKLIYPQTTFDHTSFAPISLVATSPFVYFVHPKLPIHNLTELVAYNKANPGKLSYGSMGTGTASHLLLAEFNSVTGADILHVPFQGASPALMSLLGGQVDMMTNGLTSTLTHVKQGNLRAIAVASAKRHPTLPNVPSMNETYPGLHSAGNWFALMAPPGTPDKLRNDLAAAIAEILKQPDVIKSLEQMLVDPVGSSPADLKKYMARESKVWGDVIRANHIASQ